MLRPDNLPDNSVFVIKLACANLALKTSTANLLNSGVSIYLSLVCFLTKLLTLGILFSTVVSAVFVAKPLTSGILPYISVILVL